MSDLIFEILNKSTETIQRLEQENARLREALESIASVGNEHLTNLDELLEISKNGLADVIINDTKLAREALGVK